MRKKFIIQSCNFSPKPAIKRNPKRERCFYSTGFIDPAIPRQVASKAGRTLRHKEFDFIRSTSEYQPGVKFSLDYTIHPDRKPFDDILSELFSSPKANCRKTASIVDIPVSATSDSLKKTILKLFFLTIGTLIMAMAINIFIAPYNFAFGGISGISIIVNEIFGISLGITFWTLSIPIFLLSMKMNGFPFTVRSVFATTLVAFFLILTDHLQPVPCYDIFAAMCGGVLMGLSVAAIFQGGGSTGGTPMVAYMLKRYFPLRVSIFMIDSSVIMTGAVIFGIDKALYSIILVLFLAQTAEYGTKNLRTLFGNPDDNDITLSSPSATGVALPTD